MDIVRYSIPTFEKIETPPDLHVCLAQSALKCTQQITRKKKMFLIRIKLHNQSREACERRMYQDLMQRMGKIEKMLVQRAAFGMKTVW
ncbi:hypothetical protein ANCCAN_26213 [Ancylostoma caninum]|uniref:Uncharacterized protein n=1 Tax=Ancylostoma caninum TaxID=29170 RepID=A0A368F903_ANCCA|nr:hypothetical protein ANCCAN_26213 [Ancylostoma caninum]